MGFCDEKVLDKMPQEMSPHIWMNYLLAGLAVLLLAGSLWSWRAGAVRTKRKVLFVITAVFMILLTLVLWNWNFFALL